MQFPIFYIRPSTMQVLSKGVATAKNVHFQELYTEFSVRSCYFNLLFIVYIFCDLLNAIITAFILLTPVSSNFLRQNGKLVFCLIKHGINTFIASSEFV